MTTVTVIAKFNQAHLDMPHKDRDRRVYTLLKTYASTGQRGPIMKRNNFLKKDPGAKQETETAAAPPVDGNDGGENAGSGEGDEQDGD